MNSARERIHVVSASVSCSGDCGVGDCGHDKAEDVDSVHYTLLTRLSELLPLLVLIVYAFDCMVCL